MPFGLRRCMQRRHLAKLDPELSAAPARLQQTASGGGTPRALPRLELRVHAAAVLERLERRRDTREVARHLMFVRGAW